MKKVVLKIPPTELGGLMEVWAFNKEHMDEEIIKELNWTSFEDFLVDLLMYGIEKAAHDPVKFIRELRESKRPIFKGPEETPREDFRKAYV